LSGCDSTWKYGGDMRTCKCPECGAEIQIDDTNRDFGFCQYCGAKIVLDDYRSTQRFVDEARVKEAEVRMKELEMEERENQARRNNAKTAFKIAAIIAVVGAIFIAADSIIGSYMVIIAFFIAIFGVWQSISGHIGSDIFSDIISGFVSIIKINAESDITKAQMPNMAKFSSEAYNYSDKHYSVVEEAVSSCGFTNIKLLNMHDLTTGLLKKPGTVETVTIDGKTPIWNKWYDKSARIVISYHGFQSDS
jgi:DNA-directed RNA polymerase subunit RPC12/RpoP